MRQLFITILVFCATNFSFAQTITTAEYFVDTDPGAGNGTAITIPIPGATVNFTAIIPTASLSNGFHYVAIRTKDSDGKWGLFEVRGFYISTQTNNAANIIAAEYYYDTDPGAGNGTSITVPTPGSSFTDSLVLSIGSLPMGNHRIAIRVKNAVGQWSLLENRLFNVCTQYGPLSRMNFQTENNQVFFTNLSTGNDSTLWQFGDATTDTVLNPIKTYSVAGNFNLKLISKNICGRDTLNTIIRINGIQRINAAKGGNNGVVTVIFDGNGFTSTTPLKLQKGATIISTSDKQFISVKRIIGYFNLTAQDTGYYDVIANLGGGPLDTIKNGFKIAEATEPLVSIIPGGRTRVKYGKMIRTVSLQNKGNEDAIMVPFVSGVGHKPGIENPQLSLFSTQQIANLTNKGIFQNTYLYLSANSISGDVMSINDLDTGRRRHLLALYRIKIPAESRKYNFVVINNAYGQYEYYNHGMMTLPPLFKSEIVLNDISSPNRDCMNSFLKKAVKKNIAVSLNDAVWTACFNAAFDTLAKTMRDIVKDISLQDQSIPMKAVFSSLLVQMAQCGGSGMPASISSDNFQKIIKDVTYNWIFLENLDSIGRPCFDTTETLVFRQGPQLNKPGSINQRIADTCTGPAAPPPGECAGASSFCELAELCEPFRKGCGANDELGKIDGLIFLQIGKKLFEKVTDFFDKVCKVNSASAFCEKLCEAGSSDPNIKYGPGDNDDLKHVNYLTSYGYSIFFENLASASAPAAYVEITDTLDKTKLDISTFQTGGFGWGDSIVTPDANRGDFSILKDLRPTHPNKLRVDVRIDSATGVVKWKFFTLDTTTLQLTEDPTHGFLPPNVNGTEGMGFISFSIKPKTGVTSGNVINNSASIIFDQNAAMITPVWQHIVDTTRPQSQVVPLPPIVNAPNFVVSWGGSDAHSGIDKFAVYVSVNDSLFKHWKKFTTAVSDTFHGQFNKTYKFFSVALDRAGNYEDAPGDPYTSPDAVTTPQVSLPLSLLSFTVTKSADGKKANLRWVTAMEQNVSHFEIQRSADGINFYTIGRVNAMNTVTGSNYTWQDFVPLPKVNYYRLKMVDTDATFKMSPVRTVIFAGKDEILVYPTLTSSLIFIQSEKEISAELFNTGGQLLLEKIVKGNNSFDLSNCSPGIYIIRVRKENKFFKVTKQ